MEDIEQLYAGVNAIYEEMLTEGKRYAKALNLKRQELEGLRRSGRITWGQYREGRAKLRAEAWSALRGLKAKHDGRFSYLGGRIKASINPYEA